MSSTLAVIGSDGTGGSGACPATTNAPMASDITTAAVIAFIANSP